jgi:hypothetical protein
MRSVEEWFAEHRASFSDDMLLNKKLCEWVELEPYCAYPTGYEWPGLTDSLDLVFEHLIPKFKQFCEEESNRYAYYSAPYQIGLWFEDFMEQNDIESPSLYLCQRMNKFIEDI